MSHCKAYPFEAKCSILAKSYSILHGDRRRCSISLDKFLELCAPLIGVSVNARDIKHLTQAS
jgi:hypothetical protein